MHKAKPLYAVGTKYCNQSICASQCRLWPVEQAVDQHLLSTAGVIIIYMLLKQVGWLMVKVDGSHLGAVLPQEVGHLAQG